MTEPLVHPEVDLRDFAFMPLDVVRLRDSDLAAIATGDGFRAAVLLWCVAWHQVPAASLPADDRILARHAGYGRGDAEAWAAVKTEALRGFVQCDDGRLYHLVIAEKAREAWEAKKQRRARVQAAIDARAQRDVERDVHQGTGTGIGTGKKEPRARRAPSDAFLRFWNAWPHKVGKPAAERAFKGHEAEIEDILAGVVGYERAKPADRPWLNPATFLNQQRWKDELAPIFAPRNGQATLTPAKTPQFFVKIGSPQWGAWKQSLGKSPPVNKENTGWWFKSEWPPGAAAEPLAV